MFAAQLCFHPSGGHSCSWPHPRLDRSILRDINWANTFSLFIWGWQKSCLSVAIEDPSVSTSFLTWQRWPCCNLGSCTLGHHLGDTHGSRSNNHWYETQPYLPSAATKSSTSFSNRPTFSLFSFLLLFAALNVKLFSEHFHETLIWKVMVYQWNVMQRVLHPNYMCIKSSHKKSKLNFANFYLIIDLHFRMY